MTPAQEKVLNAVRSHYASHAYAPSYKEIADRCGFSSMATVHKHVERLVWEGHLFRPAAKTAKRFLTLTPISGRCIISRLLRDVECPACNAIVKADTTHECDHD